MPVKLRARGVVSVDAAINEDDGPLAGLWPAYAGGPHPRAANVTYEVCRGMGVVTNGFGFSLLNEDFEKDLMNLTSFAPVALGLPARELLETIGWGDDYRPSLRASFAAESTLGTGEAGSAIKEGSGPVTVRLAGTEVKLR